MSDMELAIEFSNGSRIYREPNGVGGHRYWTDSVGGGAVICDTSIASMEELRAVIVAEESSIDLPVGSIPDGISPLVERLISSLVENLSSDPGLLSGETALYWDLLATVSRHVRKSS